MTCSQARENLSLYLYGELEFVAEEEFEQHVGECSACREALEQERLWHASIGSEPVPVPLPLLSRCREQLHDELCAISEARQPVWIRCLDSLGFRSNAWSMRIAMASLLVCLGFGMSQLLMRHGFLNGSLAGPSAEMSLFDPSSAHIRMIEPKGDDGVRLVVDEIRERVIVGSRDDERIRELLLAATKDPTDPSIRVDSVEILKDSEGEDVRDALVDAVRHDPNAGVRIKALEALSRFATDAATRRTLVSVLENDKSADVRTRAISLLVAPREDVSARQPDAFGPQLTQVLKELMRSDPDEYIRMRCQQALRSPHDSTHVY